LKSVKTLGRQGKRVISSLAVPRSQSTGSAVIPAAGSWGTARRTRFCHRRPFRQHKQEIVASFRKKCVKSSGVENREQIRTFSVFAPV